MKHPIPAAALDERLAFVGTAGSGKTYAAGTCVERLLESGARVVIVDPLDVWWGLRLAADGVGKGFALPIFGGAHGDLPITEQGGALIGETVAGMSESCIVSLGGLGSKAAERRFMLAFLTALYRHASGASLLLVVDEADMFAPQRLLDRDGDAARLLGMMETVVRRGRVKGFVPWLITQRPAVLSKDVLSQADGLIAMKLTSSQDRDAIGAWIDGQADRAEGRRILASLPNKARGTGVLWMPSQAILADVAFPAKKTFDSSRTPKRGEAASGRALAALDLGALRERLAAVEVEAKASDPKALRARVRELELALARRGSEPDAALQRRHSEEIAAAERRGYERGCVEGGDKALRAVAGLCRDLADSISRAEAACADGRRLLESFSGFVGNLADDVQKRPPARTLPVARLEPGGQVGPVKAKPAPAKSPASTEGSDLSGPQMQMLTALAWWSRLGHDAPSKAQVATIARWRVTSGHIKNVAGSLRSRGLIEYPQPGTFALTDAGRAVAPEPDASTDVVTCVRAVLSGPQRQVFDVLITDPASPRSREQIVEACGWEITSGHIKNVLGAMRSLQIIDYPSSGMVVLADWIASAALAHKTGATR